MSESPDLRGMRRDSLPPVECIRCGHIWSPRVPKPLKCPRCQNYEYHRKPRAYSRKLVR